MAKWLIVSDVVQLLHVPEATIYRWIRQGDIPCVVRRGKHYFNQSTLVTWAESKHIHLEKHSLRESKYKQKKSVTQSPLIEALETGNVFHTVPSGSQEILFSEISACMNLPRKIKETLAEQLMQRELLSSTGIGNGIAVPHPKKPLGQQLKKSIVGTFFLEKPLDFKAPDGLPVFVVFVLLSADSFHHLHLLSQLARFLNNIEINDFLKHSPSLENLVDQFQKSLAETA